MQGIGVEPGSGAVGFVRVPAEVNGEVPAWRKESRARSESLGWRPARQTERTRCRQRIENTALSSLAGRNLDLKAPLARGGALKCLARPAVAGAINDARRWTAAGNFSR